MPCCSTHRVAQLSRSLNLSHASVGIDQERTAETWEPKTIDSQSAPRREVRMHPASMRWHDARRSDGVTCSSRFHTASRL